MKLNLTFFFSLIVYFILFAGFGILAYFVVDHSSQISVFKTQKIDAVKVYDRQITDQKISSIINQVGPAGPKGAKATTELELEINNLYPFDYFIRLPAGTPLVLKFSADFKNKPFAKTTFMGWITRTINKQQELIGEIFKDDENKKLGDYKILTAVWDTKDFTNHIAWDFIKLTSKELKEEYLSKIQLDAQLKTKADKTNIYIKSEVNSKLAPKADRELTYVKTIIDNKLKEAAPASDVYTKPETDTELAKKRDKTDTYTKTETDTKLGLKIDKWNIYLKKNYDTELAKKRDVGTTYIRSEMDPKLEEYLLFNWTKFLKFSVTDAGKTITKVTGDKKFSSGAFRFQKLYLKNEPIFYKGDRLVIHGRIKSTYRGWQGLMFDFRDPTSGVGLLEINHLQHWNRWHENNLVKTEKVSVNFPAGKNLLDYPVSATKHILNDYFKVKVEIIFGPNYIRIFSTSLSHASTTLYETTSVAIALYPSWYNVNNGVALFEVANIPIDFKTGKSGSQSGETMANGSTLAFIRDFSNKEFRSNRRIIITSHESEY